MSPISKHKVGWRHSYPIPTGKKDSEGNEIMKDHSYIGLMEVVTVEDLMELNPYDRIGKLQNELSRQDTKP